MFGEYIEIEREREREREQAILATPSTAIQAFCIEVYYDFMSFVELELRVYNILELEWRDASERIFVSFEYEFY